MIDDMSLIECPDCSRISGSEVSCPECGHALANIKQAQERQARNRELPRIFVKTLGYLIAYGWCVFALLSISYHFFYEPSGGKDLYETDTYFIANLFGAIILWIVLPFRLGRCLIKRGGTPLDTPT